ncbi:hypothetical protein BT96DRAFT_544366 [Gymnopus androsaceus JB14]|uniref:Uncharacterized protein n=1 Tax=Gymnopus androsaceus JB14 TaxID=1447944 RepID=A0A6A4I139_9AGAR|nr:hypothetical protein BT96DRAFT_544366 [Gymnopus androsaceus JB14]
MPQDTNGTFSWGPGRRRKEEGWCIIINYDRDDVLGKVKTQMLFRPPLDTTHMIYYRGHWLRVKRWRKGDDIGNGDGEETMGILNSGGGMYQIYSYHLLPLYFLVVFLKILLAKRDELLRLSGSQ